MREINDAFRLLAASLDSESGAAAVVVAPRHAGSGLSRADIDAMVAAMNRSSEWSLWPRMSRDRWLSVAVVMAYVIVATAILPGHASQEAGIGRAVGTALGYFWLPLYLIWTAESDDSTRDTRVVLRTIGWVLMAVPALMVPLIWAWG
jgi:hypothetical protein